MNNGEFLFVLCKYPYRKEELKKLKEKYKTIEENKNVIKRLKEQLKKK